MITLNEDEKRNARRDLAEILLKHKFTREITPQTVSSLEPTGFNIGGAFGAVYCANEGLLLSNKSSRNAGGTFSLTELVELEEELTDEFIDIWSPFKK